jgi:hypothetical protein
MNASTAHAGAATDAEGGFSGAPRGVQAEDHRARMDDLGDYLREQREAEFAASGWAPQSGYGGYRY